MTGIYPRLTAFISCR